MCHNPSQREEAHLTLFNAASGVAQGRQLTLPLAELDLAGWPTVTAAHGKYETTARHGVLWTLV